MMSLQAGDVVWVPFPHVESNRIQPRPALLVSKVMLGPETSLGWALMITSAAHAHWPGDIPITDHLALKLPIPSKVRTEKIATLDLSQAHYLGTMSLSEYATVLTRIATWFTLNKVAGPSPPGFS